MESTRTLKLGILGMSEGNGHPYSWAAIFNGYNATYMKDCPFPVIFQYLSEQSFPRAAIKGAEVTHIWTQDRVVSEHIAKASCIKHVVENYVDMIGQVDAILLARDDAEYHLEMSKPFINAGLPIFIDKPLGYNLKEAKKILVLERYIGQIFSCSSLKYAEEFLLTNSIKEKVGNIKFIDAVVPKSWKKYAIHVIEPVLNIIGYDDVIAEINTQKLGDNQIISIYWKSGITTVFKALGNTKTPLSIRVCGENGYQDLVFKDSFNAFKNSLQVFVEAIKYHKVARTHKNMLKAIEIIDKGDI